MGRNGFMIREKEGVWHVMDKIAVLIPCFNEGLTIRKVVDDFRKELPNADIYVYDKYRSTIYAEAINRGWKS